MFQSVVRWLAPIWNPMALMPPVPGVPREMPDEPQSWRQPIPGETPVDATGQGKSFYGLKPYTAGDDTRLLDWAVYARTRHPHIRQYHHDARTLVWLVVLDSPAWHTGFHHPLNRYALDALTLALPDNTTQVGLWWLSPQGWTTQAPASRPITQHWLNKAWQHPPNGLYPYTSAEHPLAVIPERAFRQHTWLIFSPLGDDRLHPCLNWGVPINRSFFWAFTDPWWQRWQPAMTGAPIQTGANTTVWHLDNPGRPSPHSTHLRIQVIDTQQPLASQIRHGLMHAIN